MVLMKTLAKKAKGTMLILYIRNSTTCIMQQDTKYHETHTPTYHSGLTEIDSKVCVEEELQLASVALGNND